MDSTVGEVLRGDRDLPMITMSKGRSREVFAQFDAVKTSQVNSKSDMNIASTSTQQILTH